MIFSFFRGPVRPGLLPLAGLLALAGCGHALPDIPGFQAAAWRADRYACAGQRAALLPPILAARPRLYEARANDVTALLGRPDEEELLAQTEKVYHYYLVPGAQCGPRHPHAATPRLSIHFGPLGTVTEVQSDPLPPEALSSDQSPSASTSPPDPLSKKEGAPVQRR